MNTIEGMKRLVLAQLVQARNQAQAGNVPQPGQPVYRNQKNLMLAAGIASDHTLRNDIMTQLALEMDVRAPGWVLVENRYEGYRLVDQATKRDLKLQLRKLRTARTILARVGVVLAAPANAAVFHMIAASISGIVAQIEIAISALDQAI